MAANLKVFASILRILRITTKAKIRIFRIGFYWNLRNIKTILWVKIGYKFSYVKLTCSRTFQIFVSAKSLKKTYVLLGFIFE
ncbi:hypothetical protein LEP1GSC188_1399 [Leptospira weilii serovar Topaz str. LT2116]|uniref:Uncharacterized protein n=1 Tax=Leptospira weilii serovar Topaz str. LT2116 TaxID=1088540 RepID=M3FTS1_9LEPT|nr:hypothetical protein LEP1GSC188_1399 [Leptospira weilii serovar Topaz str. LT2116]